MKDISKQSNSFVKSPTRFDGSAVEAVVSNINRTSFDEIKTASRFAQIELKSAVDSVSNLRNYVNATNGSVTVNNTGEYRVSTTAVANAFSHFESGERGRYISGYEAEAGVGLRIPDATIFDADSRAEWGYFDEDDGLGYGVDANGIYVFTRRLGVNQRIYQSDWNKDTLTGENNGENPSGYTLNLSNGIIYNVEFIWYGYGAIQWFINIKDAENSRGSIPVLVHIITPSQQTSISQPNLPISIYLNNGTSETAKEIFVGGRQFSIYGEPNQKFRINGEYVTDIDITTNNWTPLISFRRKDNRGDNQSINVNDVSLIPDGTVAYTFVSNGTLNNNTFGNLTDVSPDETAIEVNTTATTITGGTFFGGVYIATGSRNSASVDTLRELNFDFVNSNPVTLVVKRVGSTTVNIAAAKFNVREQW